MSAEATSETMRSYLEALLSRADFAEYFTDDVTWTVVGTDQTMQGREPVRNFLTWIGSQQLPRAASGPSLWPSTHKPSFSSFAWL